MKQDLSPGSIHVAYKLVQTHRNKHSNTSDVICLPFVFSSCFFWNQELTGGKGVDIAVEALGKPQTFAQCTQSVKDGGRAIMIGLSQAGAVGEIDINRLVRRKVIMLTNRFDCFCVQFLLFLSNSYWRSYY